MVGWPEHAARGGHTRDHRVNANRLTEQCEEFQYRPHRALCQHPEESQEALDDFFNKRLLPEMKKLNVSPPTGEFYPLYNANAYVGVNRFKPTR